MANIFSFENLLANQQNPKQLLINLLYTYQIYLLDNQINFYYFII
jgi:hypothetical protein